MPKQIVVVGSVNLDLVCIGKRIPAPGETLQGTDFKTFHGGKGANQAVGVARLGYPVAMIAKVGDDEFGPRLRKGLRDANVDVRRVVTAPGVTSGVALISVDAEGQNSINIVAGANAELKPRDLEASLPVLRSAGIILAQLEIPMETVELLGTLARRFNVPLMLDPAPARRLSKSLLRNVTFVTPNETEAGILANAPGSRNGDAPDSAYAAEMAELLKQSGAANVVLKLGKRGAFVAGAGGEREMVRAFKVKTVDSTAAGDSFNAAMAVALMRGSSLVEAARYGAAAGAISTTRMGAQASMPSADEVSWLLASSNGSRNGSRNGNRHLQLRSRSGRPMKEPARAV